ncbi:hypothetical protein AEGHOMDF_1727 [Methylobacterium soli]|nr:hypothetical protein AEGHOMDF_1727 [Methylobacterium soli]
MVAELVGRTRRAHDHEGRRVQTQGLIDDRPRQRQPALQCLVPRELDSGRLRGNLLLNLGRQRQEIAGPEECHRGGLVARQDHGGDLIAQVCLREAFTRLRIARGGEEIEEVPRGARPRLRGLLGGARGDDSVEKRSPFPAEARPREIEGRGQAQGQEHVEEMRSREALAVLRHEIAQGRPVACHPHREHGAPGNLQGEAVQSREQVDGTAGGGLREIGEGRLDRGGDVGHEFLHGLRGEGRGERPALAAPHLPLADQQPVAQNRAQDPDRGRGAGVIGLVVDEDVADRVRIAEGEGVPPEDAPRHDRVRVGAPGPAADAVGAQSREVGEGWRVPVRRLARGWHEARGAK